MSLRIALADDHGIVLDGVRSSLEKAGFRVIGQVKDGLDIVKLVSEQTPDLVLMDISMPGMNGIEATRRITAQAPGVKVLCLSMHAERQLVAAALEAGASGYLLKEMAVEELLTAIRTVMEGKTYLCHGVVEKVERAATWQFAVLTSREREVLQLIAEGHSNGVIADRLCVSAKTVSSHRQHIMDKLNIHNAVGLTKYAIRHGLSSTGGGAAESGDPPRSH